MNAATVYAIADFRALLCPPAPPPLRCQSKPFHGLRLRAAERQHLADRARRSRGTMTRAALVALASQLYA